MKDSNATAIFCILSLAFVLVVPSKAFLTFSSSGSWDTSFRRRRSGARIRSGSIRSAGIHTIDRISTISNKRRNQQTFMFYHQQNSFEEDELEPSNIMTLLLTSFEEALPPPPPLTAIAIERRMKEISLLKQLEYCNQEDDPTQEVVIHSLWELWSMERGKESQAILLQAEQAMAIGNFTQAQTLLHSLIQQYGKHWAEPINKLATLHYMTGNLSLSKQLCQIVLQIKPWHFGALSGIVLVCVAMKDVTSARFWADRRLPPLLPLETSGGDRRSIWVQRAVQDAQESLRMAYSLRNRRLEQDEKEDNKSDNDEKEKEEKANEERYIHPDMEDSWQ